MILAGVVLSLWVAPARAEDGVALPSVAPSPVSVVPGDPPVDDDADKEAVAHRRRDLYREQSMQYDDRRYVVDGFGDRLSTEEVMRRLDDKDGLKDFRRTRKMQKAIWGASIVTASTFAGAATVMLLPILVGCRDAGCVYFSEGLIAVPGVVGLAISLPGSIIQQKRRNDATTWYEPHDLRARLKVYDAEVAKTVGVTLDGGGMAIEGGF